SRGAIINSENLTRVGPELSTPDRSWPWFKEKAGGPLYPVSGLRAANTSRSPNSAGRAPNSHPTEAPFWRRRAPAQFPATPTRHF
ncbi:hypothetical protein MC885_007018, partial [Smutsia gigantea]